MQVVQRLRIETLANHPVAPFYQLGRRVALLARGGDGTGRVVGEVMDTDTGWIAIKDEANDEIRWYNLDHIIHIAVLGQDAPD